ncbi:MAG: DUF1684 domain-containing protein [Thermoanaerobaculia bacterium]
MIAAALFAVAFVPAGAAEDVYAAEIEAWRAARFERLRRPDGWLTLAGLFWLDPGANSFGSDPANRVVLPAGTPGCMGELVLEGGSVRLRTLPGMTLTTRGKSVADALLRTDADGDPTVLEYGHVSFFVIKRRDRFAVRVKNSASQTLSAFGGLDAFRIEARWRFEARFEPYDPPKQVLVPNVIGGADREICPGAIVFDFEGATYRLDPVLESGTDELFIIFGDRTNGFETYGAGRFLYAKRPEKDGRLILDFNKAYNPPCVFTPYATCPLPPAQNRLPFRVEAGEKVYGDH